MRYTNKKLFINIVYSFLFAIMLTILFCGLYTFCRNYLSQCIENNSIGFLENFNLIEKIQEKCHFDTIPTIWQLQETFMQISKLFIFFFGLSLLIIFMPINEWKEQGFHFYFYPPKEAICQFFYKIKNSFKHANKRWMFFLLVLMAIQYVVCYSIIYYSWWSGDDFYCTMTSGKSFFVRYFWWIWCCLTHVARVGEMIYYIFPLSPDRWSHLFITPAIFVSFPFAVKRIVAPNLSWTSAIGTLFYLSSCCLIYLGTNGFSTFCCYAPCTGYIYSSIFVLFIIPYYIYGIDRTNSYSFLSIIVFCLCSFIFGSSTEGIAAIFTVILASQLLWRYFKGMSLPPLYYFSLIAFWVGATWLLFSPGATIRGMNTPFTGGNVPYNFYGMSILEKLSYIPDMLFAIWKVTRTTLILYAITFFVWLHAYVKLNYKEELKKKLYYSLLIALISLSMAIIYIAGAIPNGSTFTPCSYGLICALLYLVVALCEIYRSNILILIFSVTLCIINICYIFPSLTYSVYLKPYDIKRSNLLYEQINQGEKTIILPYRYPDDYDSTRTTIPHGVNLNNYARYLKVDEIIEAEKP